jgi:radical SAM superfamily enzyme YgiQ (UPF0313 family)
MGFKSILIGIETINTSTQKLYNKQLSLDSDTVYEKLLKLKKSGIDVTVFILFNPVNETFRNIKLTLNWLKRQPVNFASLSYIIPYPDTIILTTTGLITILN